MRPQIDLLTGVAVTIYFHIIFIINFIETDQGPKANFQTW